MNNERNPYGYATNEWYEFEAKKAGYSSVREHLTAQKATAPRCPYCGTPSGFSFGIGDCGCSDE